MTIYDLKDKMPELIAQMKAHLEGNEKGCSDCIREFMVGNRKVNDNGARVDGFYKRRFVCDEQDHVNLRGKLDVLENLGFIRDVTKTGEVQIYRMTEAFVEYVLHGIRVPGGKHE